MPLQIKFNRITSETILIKKKKMKKEQPQRHILYIGTKYEGLIYIEPVCPFIYAAYPPQCLIMY